MSHVRECPQCGEIYVPANGPCETCGTHVVSVGLHTEEIAMKTRYEVRAYSKTGTYSEIIESTSAKAALARGLAIIRRHAFGRLLSWDVAAAR